MPATDGDALFVVVSGPPASGKSTIAPQVAGSLRLPLLAKDTVKEALMAVLPPADVEASRSLGRAAFRAVFAVAAESSAGAVLEAPFHRTAAGDIARLPGTVIEVFCRCDRDVALRRYRARAASRQPGHFDTVRKDHELWNDDVARPVAGGWPVIEVDTNRPVDVTALAAEIRRTASPDPSRPGVGADRAGSASTVTTDD
jgi:predicted kinase